MKDDITNYLELRLQEARLVGDEVSDEFIIPYLEELIGLQAEVELCGECGQPTVSVKGWSDKY